MERKIKVLHFVSGLISGGVEQMLYNYCKFMDSSKYEFIIAYQHEAVKSCKDKIESVGCRTVRITARNKNFIKNISDSYKLIKKEQPDIVHAHMNLMNFCALFAAKMAGVKVRISHSHIAEKNRGTLFQMMAEICKVLCIRTSTDLMTCGYEAGIYLYGSKNMNSGNVKLVENAVDLGYYQIDPDERKTFRRENLLEDKFIVGHIGRFSYQKNHEKLIKIFRELLSIKENAILLLVGTGELEEKIKEEVENLGLRDKVIFYGTTRDMKKIYSAIDVFVLPSRFEGFPMVSIEVQAADIPAIFSDTVAPTCKITDAINFVPIDADEKTWANKILEVYSEKKQSDLGQLKEKYDIRSKAKMLERYYNIAMK